MKTEGRKRLFIRNFNATDHLEEFLVSAVSAILAIRLFLYLTGYPSIGGVDIHVAHVLWGGLLMLVAIVIQLSFLGEVHARLSAAIGGIGFGAFIDEVGKFVTRDNDYFYEPAVALIYITFILVFLAVRGIHTRREYSRQEYLLNALRELEEMALHDLDKEEAEQARRNLAQSDPAHPLVRGLENALDGCQLVPVSAPGRVTRLREMLSRLYRRVTRHPRFDLVIILVFVGQLLIKLAYGTLFVLLFGFGWSLERAPDWQLVGDVVGRLRDLDVAEAMELGAAALSGLFVLLGVVRLVARRRVSAYRMFERAILVSILLVQVFSFYNDQFLALVELVFNLTMLVLLRTMIHLEEAPSGR